jgi:hypothetical protein
MGIYKKYIHVANSDSEVIDELLFFPKKAFGLSVKKGSQDQYILLYGFITVFGPITNHPGQMKSKDEIIGIIIDTLNGNEYDVYLHIEDNQLLIDIMDYIKDYNKLLITSRPFTLNQEEEENLNKYVSEKTINILYTENRNLDNKNDAFVKLKTLDKKYLSLHDKEKQLFFITFPILDKRPDVKILDRIYLKVIKNDNHCILNFYDENYLFISEYNYKLNLISDSEMKTINNCFTYVERVNWGKKIENSKKILYQTILFYLDEEVKNILLKNQK